MNVLFLDIDGVLNSIDDLNSRSVLWMYSGKEKKSRDEYGQLFDERCLRWLECIVIKTDCKIVVSSTWRRSGIDYIKNMWKHRNLPGEVIDITPQFASNYIVEKYKSGNEKADRGYEIEEWLESNKVDNYCILDDDSDMLSHQHFVKTDSLIGLNRETAFKVIKHFNKEEY